VRTFPLHATLTQAYAHVLGRLDLFARSAGLWLAFLVLLLAAEHYLLGSVGEAPNLGGERLPQVAFLDTLRKVGWFLGIHALAVFWQRSLLLGEDPTAFLAPVNMRVIRYIGVGIAVTLCVAIPIVLLAIVLGTLLAGPSGGLALALPPWLQLLVIWILTVLALVRIHLVLPAIAIGDRTMTVTRSWRLTARHWPLVLIGLVAASLPAMLVNLILQAALETGGVAQSVTGYALRTTIDFLQVAIAASFLALSYRAFMAEPGRGEAAPTAS
jgi:hypothetical protein